MPPAEDNKPESGLWKDYLNRGSVTKIAEEIGRVDRGFDQRSFVEASIDKSFSDLELKQRITAIARTLHQFLPNDYGRSMRIFRKAAPHLGGFENWALMSFIELYGLDHFDDSIAAMKDLTRYGTAEFAIRPFMIRYERKMLPVLHRWAGDSNEHVRRLAAEGSRPRGVWTQHIESFKKDPRPVLALLEKLKADPSLYVRKAVANNLNDISKDHPDLVIETALAWNNDGNKHTDWIVKHACRSLIKKGNPKVFPIFGFTSSPKVEVRRFRLSRKKVKIGSSISLSFDLVSGANRSQKLAIDYRLHYVKKNGKRSPRVFKLSEKVLGSGKTVMISTRHSFENRCTRIHYPGEHRLDLIINGRVVLSEDFSLAR
ncbi:MAG: DNA alkylation repair protein [Candidatus Zixiibacteriota bacterium]|nr:MAG: DNA alkylation repair protein [candidate division Zixibacteria bacterium]